VPEDDQDNEHRRGNRAFSSDRVLHQRHKRLLANSPQASGNRKFASLAHPILPGSRASHPRREVANRIRRGGKGQRDSESGPEIAVRAPWWEQEPDG
jgi:hypothetical protein